VLPDGASVTNPVDVTAAVSEEQLTRCVDLLTRSPGVDAVVVALVPTAAAAATGDDLVRALARALPRRERPVLAVRLEQDLPVRLPPAADDGAIPSYADPLAAARSLAHAVARAAWLARPAGVVPDLDGVETQKLPTSAGASRQEFPSARDSRFPLASSMMCLLRRIHPVFGDSRNSGCRPLSEAGGGRWVDGCR
jgi:acyl-CoA synthetase (NDP forming)